MPSSEFFDGVFRATAIIVIVCCSLGVYNALELMLLILTTFKSYTGLYFWSLAIATFGVLPYCTGEVVIYFRVTSLAGGLVLLNYGWCTMVTGQAVVLYSRLGIVLGAGHKKILRAVKWMIAIDAVVLHVTTITVSVGNWYSPNPGPWRQSYNYVEKIQMTVFCIQEFIISGLYVWKALEIIRTVSVDKKKTQRIMRHLFAINVIIIIFDIALLVIEYLNWLFDEIAFKALVYSLKLKLEFAILNQLVEYSGVKQSFPSGSDDVEFYPTTEILNSSMSKVESNRSGHGSTNHKQEKEKSQTAEHIDNSNKIESHNLSLRSANRLNSFVDESKATGVDTTHSPQLQQQQHPRKDSADLYADAIRSISHT